MLIVVSMIVIIATISIPMFLRSRLSAEESAAIATLRTIHISQEQALNQNNFPNIVTKTAMYPTLSQLGTLAPAPLPEELTNFPNIKNGYQYSINIDAQTQSNPTFFALALNASPSGKGRNFYIAPEGVIRYTIDGSTPTSASLPIN